MDNPATFLNRTEAGEKLTKRLAKFRKDNPVILGIPRGGMAVATEIATDLSAPLYPLIVKKISAPHEEELAIGAIGEFGIVQIDENMVRGFGISAQELEAKIADESAEISRRAELYRGELTIPDLSAHVVIIVDDGLATGMTGRVAIESARAYNPKKLVFAIPVCSEQSASELANLVDEIICLENASDLSAVGNYYQDFSIVTDDEVLGYLKINNLDTSERSEDVLHEPQSAGEEEVGGSMMELEEDDDTEAMARKAGIKTDKVHQ